MATESKKTVETSVMVVGGGGCGLVSSIMLSNLGIKHVLVEAHPTTAQLPKASLLNQRTAEILHQHGVWDEIEKVACPPEKMKWYHYMDSLGGSDSGKAYIFDHIPCYGCNDDPGFDEDYVRYRRNSAFSHRNLPLIALEPLLKAEAEKRNPGNILFNHKMVAFKEDSGQVELHVRNKEANETALYRVQYVIAADGGKTFPEKLGISYNGTFGLADTTSLHIKADLSSYWPDEGTLITWLVGLQGKNESLSTGSSLFGGDWSAVVVNGPSWGKQSEEWALHLALGQSHVPLESLSNDDLKRIVRSTLGIPDLNLEILKSSRWHIDGVYAKQYATNRIFLAGDAAHRHPPVTGLGLNTAIGDAHNLTWKLAAVIHNHASPAVLQTYEQERLPVGKRVVDWALFAFLNLRVLDSATGLLPGGKLTMEANKRIMSQLTSDSFDGGARRAALRHAIQSQRVETAALDLELGSVYPEGAIISDGETTPQTDPRGSLYVPVAKPGHRLPHAWIFGSQTLSTHHLLDCNATWVLITDDTVLGDRWIQEIAKREEDWWMKIRCVRIGEHGDFRDRSGQWAADSGLKDQGGAVLVRPDGYVAFRAINFSEAAMIQLDRLVRDFKAEKGFDAVVVDSQ